MKSCYELINETVPKLSPAQWTKFKSWRESSKPTAEEQCNFIDAMLKEIGAVHDEKHGKRESVRKHNGRADNGGEEFRESAGDGEHTITSQAHAIRTQYVELHHLSESDARRVVGLPTKERSECPAMDDIEWQLFESLCVAGRPEREAYAVATGKTLKS